MEVSSILNKLKTQKDSFNNFYSFTSFTELFFNADFNYEFKDNYENVTKIIPSILEYKITSYLYFLYENKIDSWIFEHDVNLSKTEISSWEKIHLQHFKTWCRELK